MEISSLAKTIRVLSIDGGGMRGLYTAAYLHGLLHEFARSHGSSADDLDFGKSFDLIVGTSTGGILACGLALGVPPSRMVTLYRSQGKRIFPAKVPSGLFSVIVQFFTRRRHLRSGNDALSTALEEAFGNITIRQLYEDRGIALAIPAIEMSRHAPWVFKTNHLERLEGRDDDYRLVDVCLATSAAPIFRSLASLKNPNGFGHRVFADGGLWANTPILLGLLDALDMSGDGDCIELYSLGTCPRPVGQVIAEDEIHKGFLEWKFGANAAALALDAQEVSHRSVSRILIKYLKRDCILVDFPSGPVAGEIMRFLDLDETSDEAAEALIAQANADVTVTMSRCAQSIGEADRVLKALLTDILPRSQSVMDD